MSIIIEPGSFSPWIEPEDYAAFQNSRQEGLGGNDMAVLSGYGRTGLYEKTAHDIYASKVDPWLPSEPSPDAKRGIMFEATAVELFRIQTGRGVIYPLPLELRSIAHSKFPWAKARVDGLVPLSSPAEGSESLVLEVKCPRGTKYATWKAEGLEKALIVQGVWYLGITGAPALVWWVFCPEEYEVTGFEFTPDPSVFEWLLEIGDKFWTEHVEPRRPPDLYVPPEPGPELPESAGTLRRLDPDEQLEALTARAIRAGSNYSDAKSVKEDARAAVKALLDEFKKDDSFLLDDGAKIYYKRQDGKPSFDEKALRNTRPLDRTAVALALAGLPSAALLRREVEEALDECGLDLDQFVSRGAPYRSLRIYAPKEGS